MYRVQYHGYNHARMFHEALQIKCSRQGKPYSRADFDKWTGDYDVSFGLFQAPKCDI